MSFFQITPPFKPQVMNETDTSNFDFEFTGASVELTPPEHDDGPSEYGTIAEAAGEETDEPFSQFSYDPGASVMTNSSSLQSRSVLLKHFVNLVFFTLITLPTLSCSFGHLPVLLRNFAHSITAT